MKTFFISLLLSLPLYAKYGKPELLARFSGPDSFNAPFGLFCYASEPAITKQGVFLGCMDGEHFMMVRWSPKFSVLSKAVDQLFSVPLDIQGTVSWHEFDETGLKKLYVMANNQLKVTELRNLGPQFSLTDSLLPVGNGNYVYRLEDDKKKLMFWRDGQTRAAFEQDVAHIFPPVTSHAGNFLIKVRRGTTDESSPDELIYWDGKFHTVLWDRDTDPRSRFKSFRHQMAFDRGNLVFIAEDDKGEALYLLRGNRLTELARAGRDLLSFDYFSPKVRDDVIVFRGMNQQKKKVVYVVEGTTLRPLITQGDIVKTDKGPGKVDYQDQDALFYGAPGIGPSGEIIQQATLTHPESGDLIGVGLLKFVKK